MAEIWPLSSQIADDKNVGKKNASDHNIKNIVVNLLILERYK